MEVLHNSIELFRGNPDIVPHTKQFDKELADRFAVLIKPYAIKTQADKTAGWSIDVRPLLKTAREQLAVWGERNNATVIAQESGDPAAVVFDAIASAQAKQLDVVIADTAGRLPTQLHLMDELKKVKRVADKALPGAPHEIILVLDGNMGQNALAQVKAFDEAIGLTGLIITKLDGTAKGGVLAALAVERNLPVYFIGVGEGVQDLQTFDAEEFAQALLGE